MADQQTVDAIAAAAQRLGAGKVRVVMTGDVNGQNKYAAAYNQLLAAGVTIHLFPGTDDVLYIHAKALVADTKDAYVGSTNISSASMNFNRELGLLFTDQTDVIAPVVATFERDFADPVAVPWTQQTPAPSAEQPTPDEGAATSLRSPAVMEQPVGSSNTPMTCGPIVQPTPWPPASTSTTTSTTTTTTAGG
jgi:phosphatidylserine/phosphatidylglycerophosphate/cardiolipin synthase-like enzyme